ncbi:claudin-15 isoform X2 [Hippopotamus amphibius kiboko]|uniref:claudin-15 isoform X2 n=1 Tax=Hippopotamus amphibius kiboko TaxID=575201 RepID=UPI00259863BD|nr:claudin-15 isoform X2 [Hippopotamus amphibius kiboko]
MSAAVEIFGFFVTALGLLMLGVTLTHSSWRVSTVHGNVITTNTIFENLWYSCATDSLGVYNCWEFPSMLALSGYIQACRALMISAILLGFLGLFLGMVGLHCTNIGSLELSRKTKLAATAGALHILAGPSVVLLSLPQVSAGWWPSPGTPSTSPGTSSTPCIPEPSECGSPTHGGSGGARGLRPTRASSACSSSCPRYELGPALYLGWSASLLAILGGICLFSNCCCSQDEDPIASVRLPYKASAMPAKSLTARLPTAASGDAGDSSFGKYGKKAYV